MSAKIQVSLEDLEKVKSLNIPEEVAVNIVTDYLVTVKHNSHIRLIMAVIFVVVMLYNIFFAGNSYSISTANTIMITLFCIEGVLATLMIYQFVLFMKAVKKIRKVIKRYSAQSGLEYKPAKKAYANLLKQEYGGLGL
ncbi:hypothetical protein [Fulvivirga ligni]|uniref:hypothetical protein n=1 Tax=Fulvivirga ligni TaxID=2904246 RepID=UPI001F16EA48|nr:hypothetical protein [Fulvivirga ligni]UII19797.1 hypothetical protein LVD16_18305 [Fulvivirga ligni]